VPITTEFGGALNNDYNDEQCTQPVRECYDPVCEGSFVVDQELDESVCGVERPVVAVWSYRELATGLYRMDPGGPCQLVGDVTEIYWQVDSVDADEFVTLELQTR
jgi:hypothetical protein